MTECDNSLQNNTIPSVEEIQQNEIDVQETYNGPWIEKRIEYKANDHKHHQIMVFGSWNGFRKGEDLEYQGKQIYVATIKFPLGSWLYRFQIDNEDWETNNETAKTVKDGVEFNTITIKEKESDFEEEAEDEKNDESGKSQHTQVIFDESSQKFVVGKKKKHGRPSMELDLGKDFDDDTAQPEDAEEVEEEDEEEEEEHEVPQEKHADNQNINNDTNNVAVSSDTVPLTTPSTIENVDNVTSSAPAVDITTTTANKEGKSRNRNNKHKKRQKKKKTQNKAQAEQEKEFARKVFVEQLRQQQQHEDEVARVKSLWKQERQVRIEAHKKIVKEKNKLSKDIIQLQAENERLQALGKMGNFSENQKVHQLETEKEKYETEIKKCNEELKKTQDKLSLIQKEKFEEAQKNLDFEKQKKNLIMEIASLTSTITDLKTQNFTLENSLNSIKQSNKQTIAFQSEQLTNAQDRWKTEKEKLLRDSEELMKLKNDIVELKKDLSTISDAKNESDKKCENEKRNNEELARQINMLNAMLENLNKAHNDKNQNEKSQMESIQKQLENEKLMLQEKVNQLNEKLVQHIQNSKEEELKNKVHHLENELTSLNNKYNNENKENAETQHKLQSRLDELQEEINAKIVEINKIVAENNEYQQKIENYKRMETTLNEKISLLQDQLKNAENEMSTKSKEFEDSIQKYILEINSNNEEKNQKVQQFENEISTLRNEITDKLKACNEMEAKNQQLQYNMELEVNKNMREKNEYEKQLTIAQQKEERIHTNCKTLFTKFQSVRDEMKCVKALKIGQLEEMQKSFQELSPILNKLFQFNQVMIDNLMEKYKRELTLRRKYFNTLQDLRGNIRVFCRVRPLLQFELDQKDTSCLTFPYENSLIVTDEKSTEHPFDFDRVYTPNTRQEDVSEDTTEYIQSVMDGYNVSIFAYGQTGSGKTFTMDGADDNPGVNLRALRQLFKMAEDRAPMFEYTIKVSIFEIYNEEIRDLIASASTEKKTDKNAKKEGDYKVRHLPDGGVEVVGLTWIPVTSDADVVRLSNIAKKHRSAGVTDMNAHSSRSHMLLVVEVKGFNKPANIEYLGKLYLVDLAGSERVKKSGAQGQALKEAQNINSSLAALGDVMQALQEKRKFVPYRNSTLTDLMTNSLGGNAKTVMFINCCPTARHAFETVSSLKFASRVAKVELGQAKATVTKK